MKNRFKSYSTSFLSEKRPTSCSRSMNGFEHLNEKMDKMLIPRPVLIEFFDGKDERNSDFFK